MQTLRPRRIRRLKSLRMRRRMGGRPLFLFWGAVVCDTICVIQGFQTSYFLKTKTHRILAVFLDGFLTRLQMQTLRPRRIRRIRRLKSLRMRRRMGGRSLFLFWGAVVCDTICVIQGFQTSSFLKTKTHRILAVFLDGFLTRLQMQTLRPRRIRRIRRLKSLRVRRRLGGIRASHF